jgi:hypothetical protein
VTRLWLAMLALAWLGWAQEAAAEPTSQEQFRAVLLKYDERADAESDIERLRALAAERSAELAAVLGPGLRFDNWRLILSGIESTPMGGFFLRLLDSMLNKPKSVRPTYWNSGPGAILRQAEITATSPLHGSVALLKRGTMVVVSGSFFADADGGPFYESARISLQDLLVERSRFRTPYFSIRLDSIEELFPEPRFP